MAFRYNVDVNYNRVSPRELFEWCKENVGSQGITWNVGGIRWRFRFKRDYTMFLLRWA